jgi:hypothetical protein
MAITVWAMTVPQAEPAMPQPEAVHEPQVEHDVEAESADGRDQRGLGVLEATQDAGRRQDDEHGRDAEGGDAEVDHCLLEGALGGAEDPAERFGGCRHGCGGDRAQGDGEPGAVDAPGDGTGTIARAELAGDDGGGAVGEEDEDVGGGQQDGAGDAETGQRLDAEAPDDGGVGEEEQRLGDQGEEGRDGQAQHLAVLPGLVPAAAA